MKKLIFAQKASIAFAIAASFCMLGNTQTVSALTNVSNYNEFIDAINGEDPEIAVTGQIVFNEDIEIDGKNYTVTRDKSYTGNLFYINADKTVKLSNITIDGGAPNWVAKTGEGEFEFRIGGSGGDRAYGRFAIELGTDDIRATAPLINNAGTLSLENTKVQNAYSTAKFASAIENTGSLTINKSQITHNSNPYFGAINHSNYNNYLSTASLTISDSIISNNNSGDYTNYNNGGAISALGGNISIDKTTFQNNSAQNDGGAIHSGNATITVSNSTFKGNITGNDGSAVRLGISGSQNKAFSGINTTATFTNNSFQDNLGLTYYFTPETVIVNGVEKTANGNAQSTFNYYNYGYSQINITGGDFSNNRSTFDSTIAIYDESEDADAKSRVSANISGVTFNNNKEGYAVSLSYLKEANVSDLTFNENSGVIRAYENASFSMTNVSAKNNSKDDATNGSYYLAQVFNNDSVTIDNLDWTNNAGLFGVINQDATIKNSNFSNNDAKGLYFYSTSAGKDMTVNIENSTFQNNTEGTLGGGAIFANATSLNKLTVNIDKDTVISNNRAQSDYGSYNSTGQGGGIYMKAANGELNIADGAIISDNTALTYGDNIVVEHIANLGDSNGIKVNAPVSTIDDTTTDETNGYLSTIVKDGNKLAFTITKITIPENPKTSDDIISSIALLLASTSILALVISKKK